MSITVGKLKKILIDTIKNDQQNENEENIKIKCEKIKNTYFLSEIRFYYDNNWVISKKMLISKHYCDKDDSIIYINSN